MPRMFVAFRTDSEEEPQRLADGSNANMKKRLRAYLDTSWCVAFYVIKPDVKTIAQIIEDLSEVEATEAQHYRVNAHGQVRKIDAPEGSANVTAPDDEDEEEEEKPRKKAKKKSKKSKSKK